VIAALSASESIEDLTPERLALLREELLKLASAIRIKVLPDFSMGDGKAAAGDKLQHPAPRRDKKIKPSANVA
jgi:hypothetical protein